MVAKRRGQGERIGIAGERDLRKSMHREAWMRDVYDLVEDVPST